MAAASPPKSLRIQHKCTWQSTSKHFSSVCNRPRYYTYMCVSYYILYIYTVYGIRCITSVYDFDSSASKTWKDSKDIMQQRWKTWTENDAPNSRQPLKSRDPRVTYTVKWKVSALKILIVRRGQNKFAATKCSKNRTCIKNMDAYHQIVLSKTDISCIKGSTFFVLPISGSSLAIFLQRLQTKLRPSRANTIAVPPDHLVWRSVQFGWGSVSIEAMCHGSDVLWLFKTWFLFWVQSFVGLPSGRVWKQIGQSTSSPRPSWFKHFEVFQHKIIQSV